MSNASLNTRTNRTTHDEIASRLEIINTKILLLQIAANHDGNDNLHDALHDCYHAVGAVIDELRRS